MQSASLSGSNFQVMKMYRKISLAFCFLLAASMALFAQRSESEARDDLSYYNRTDNRSATNEAGNIWWGTGAILGFSAGNNSSIFRIGLSPIVGYKLNNFLSIGPRASFVYNAFREQSFVPGADDFRAKFVEWSAGPFVRARVFGQFFAHAEYSIVNEAENFNPDGTTSRVTRAIPFLGGGLSQGGGPGLAGFEILILFRLSSADRIGDAPFELRSGINFNF